MCDPDCEGTWKWESRNAKNGERWLGTCDCGQMLAFLPDHHEPVKDDPITAFLGDGKTHPVTPPWLRVFHLSMTSEHRVSWRYHHKQCGNCQGSVDYTAQERVMKTIHDFVLSLNCGQVVSRAYDLDRKPMRLPISGASWQPACLAVTMLRRFLLRPRFAFDPPWLREQ